MKGVGDGGVPEAKEQRAVLLHHVEISIVPISSAMDGRPHQRALGRGLHVVMQFESCGRADAAEYSYHSPQLCVMASIRFPAPAAGAVVAQIMFLHGHRLTREALHRRQTELRGSRDALAGDAEVVAEVSRWWQRMRPALCPLPSDGAAEAWTSGVTPTVLAVEQLVPSCTRYRQQENRRNSPWVSDSGIQSLGSCPGRGRQQ
ncbi:hypothetical protein B2J93_5910 [Marssonina coronariae]|uniref:Uncharacterized protein n=1 Tax=Diplocarpon coronariae TaxID=2795749 RepID=A0A218Z7P3_9HELO|nr:hypothetical protein B2J93_5910 [Marssonina coronariae]